VLASRSPSPGSGGDQPGGAICADRRGKGEELAMLRQLLLGEWQGQLQQGV
jgi:hypothetical protein